MAHRDGPTRPQETRTTRLASYAAVVAAACTTTVDAESGPETDDPVEARATTA